MVKDSKKKVKDKAESLQQQAEEYLDGWKRCKADFENYKKQQQEWAASFRIYAAQDVLEEIIPVIDNFELAVDHIPQTPANESWLEGISHIKKQLEHILESHNVTAIDVQPGQVFDPNIHECAEGQTSEECLSDGSKPGASKIAKVVRKGYKIGEKLLRPARVVLATTENRNDLQANRNDLQANRNDLQANK